jgi:hypothetical protein
MGVIMAVVTLSGGSMIQNTNAQTEARRLIRSAQSLRSAWLACYADTQIMPGITQTPGTDVSELISRYSDRSMADDVARYGAIIITSDDGGNRIDIGFSGPWNLPGNVDASSIKTMTEVLENQKNDYGITFDQTSDPRRLMIRIR